MQNLHMDISSFCMRKKTHIHINGFALGLRRLEKEVKNNSEMGYCLLSTFVFDCKDVPVIKIGKTISFQLERTFL